MALDERYFISGPLNQYFVDKDSGLPLAAGTLTFYRDSARNEPKQVFQLTGAPGSYTYTALPNPITLSSVGTVQNAGGDNEVIYYYPFDDQGNVDLYYIVCRDSNGIEQWSREAWPNLTAGNDPTNEPFHITNQISNPQFTNILINEGMTTTYTVSAPTNQVFEFAPNWDFVISGTGTVVVQRIAIAGNDNVVTSPPYVLDVTVSTGITSCQLRQRMNVNSGLWASTDSQSIFLAGALIARNENIGTTGLQMLYAESSGGVPVVIVDDTFTNAQFEVLRGTTATAIPSSTNTDTGENGYIDIYISFPTNSHIRLSSIQVVPTLSETGGDLLQYDINSSNREEAFQGDYYLPRLQNKEIPSILAGWDFPVNPAQLGTSFTMTATPGYTWDQTISARVNNNNTVARSSLTSGFQVTTGGNTDAFYMLQYLSGVQAKKILGTRLSVNINGWKGSVGDSCTVRVYLFRGGSAAVIPTLPNVIGSLATSGVFTKNNTAGQGQNWTEIARSGLDTATALLTTVTTNDEINDNVDYKFTGWEITSASEIGDTDKFAMVVTFSYPNSNTVITINSISLTPGDIPTRPAYKSYEDTLSECQFYYEKSYAPTVTPQTPIAGGGLQRIQHSRTVGANTELICATFGITFHQPARASNPIITLYSTNTGASANVYGQVSVNGGSGSADIPSSNWTEIEKSATGVMFQANNKTTSFAPAVGTNFPDAWVLFHYTKDARFGIV